MSDEVIPCRLEVSVEDGSLGIIPMRELRLRPGESAHFSANPPQVVVHRVWFGRRWYVTFRAYLAGVHGPDLTVESDD